MRKVTFLALVTALMPAPALACQDGEVALFGCQTLDRNGAPSENGIAICAGDQDADGGYRAIAYEYVTPKGVELAYPVNPADGKAKLFFHHFFRDQLYRARVRFENGGYTYQVYFDDNPPGTDPGEVTGPDAGVRVMKSGKVVADIACGERPASYFDDVRKATSCDHDNPYGDKACAADAPEVK